MVQLGPMYVKFVDQGKVQGHRRNHANKTKTSVSGPVDIIFVKQWSEIAGKFLAPGNSLQKNNAAND